MDPTTGETLNQTPKPEKVVEVTSMVTSDGKAKDTPQEEITRTAGDGENTSKPSAIEGDQLKDDEQDEVTPNITSEGKTEQDELLVSDSGKHALATAYTHIQPLYNMNTHSSELCGKAATTTSVFY